MAKYLISFPSEAMVLTDEEFPIVVADSHSVIAEAKAAGVYVFGGGIDEQEEATGAAEPCVAHDDDAGAVDGRLAELTGVGQIGSDRE